MELKWKELEPERLICKSDSSVLIEGELPLPDGREISKVLYSSAKASVETSTVSHDSVELSGAVTARIIALDTNGSAFAFESEAGFTHTLEAKGADSGMDCDVRASVKSISASPSIGAVSFAAEIALDADVTSSAPLRVIDGVNGVNDLELLTKPYTHSKSVLITTETLRMREELAESGIDNVLSCSGQALVREALCERDGVSVSGVLAVSAVTSDASGRISGLVRQIPFREKLSVNVPFGEVYCAARLNNITLHALGEEFALLAMEAEICFELYRTDRQELLLPADAFSPTIGFDCLYDEAILMDSFDITSVQIQFKETAELSGGMPNIESPLFAGAQAVITSVETDKDEITVSGFFATTAVYQGADEGIYSHSEDVPFSFTLPNESKCTDPKVTCVCAVQITGNTETVFQLNYTAQFDMEYRSESKIKVVAGLAEKEAPKSQSGLIIAFASKGEGFFDIAKRYNVPVNSVTRLNPEAAEPLCEGEKLLLLI